MPSTTTTTTIAPNWYPIFIQTFLILNTNSIHFITISLLFLPLIFSTSVAVIYSTSVSLISLLSFKTLTTLLAVSVTAVAGIALITYSTHQSMIKKQPITFTSTFKSLSHSFIPLLSTIIAGTIKSFIIITAVTRVIESLGLGFQFEVSEITNTFTVTIILFCIVIWGSAAPVSVLESKSGFNSLTKSENQSFEFHFISFFIMIITGSNIATCFTYYYYSCIHKKSEGKWNQIMQIGVTYLQFSLFVLLYVVANTVLYVHCKMASGEQEEEEEKTVKTVTEEEISLGFAFMIWLCTSLRVLLIWLASE